MNRIYIEYQESHVSGGDVREGDEDSDWPSYEDEYWSYEVVRATATRRDGYSVYYQAFDWPSKIPDNVHVVVVRYTNGDTFSTRHGNGCIAGVYGSVEQAAAAKHEIEKGLFPGYKPWEGYFERLEEVYTVSLEVQP